MGRISRFFVGLSTAAIAGVVALPAVAEATPDVLRVMSPTVAFGAQPVGSMTFRSTTTTNTSSETINLVVVVTRERDDFSFGLLASVGETSRFGAKPTTSTQLSPGASSAGTKPGHVEPGNLNR